MSKSSCWLVLLAAAWLCHPAAGQTPFPEFTGQRLYASGVPDVYPPLVAQIERLERSSPQTYYVVVVESAGSGQWATRDYLDKMYQT